MAAAMAVAACGSDEPESATLDAESGEILAQSVFDGTTQTIQGETFDLNELAGTDLILWFWAPW